MTDAPETIWVAGTPQECGQYFPSCVEAEGTWGGVGVQYIRADAPELLAMREAVSDDLFDVLDEAIGDNFAVENEYGGDDADYQAHRAKIQSVHDALRAALAAFDALVKG